MADEDDYGSDIAEEDFLEALTQAEAPNDAQDTGSFGSGFQSVSESYATHASADTTTSGCLLT